MIKKNSKRILKLWLFNLHNSLWICVLTFAQREQLHKYNCIQLNMYDAVTKIIYIIYASLH